MIDVLAQTQPRSTFGCFECQDGPRKLNNTQSNLTSKALSALRLAR